MKKILIPFLIFAFILTTSLSIVQVIGYEGSDNQETGITINSKKNYYLYVNINNRGNTKVGPFSNGEEIFLEAQNIEGYKFLNWEMNGEIFSEDKEISIKIDEENIKIKANYYDLVKELDKLIEKADEEILNKNYNEAQEYLLEAIESKNIHKSKYYQNLKYFIHHPYRELEEKIDFFNRENIITVKDYKESIEKYQGKKPEAPKIEILKKDQEKIRDWFYKCLLYTKRIRRDALGNSNFAELEVDDEIKEIESEYFVSPEGSYRHLAKGKLVNSEIYSIVSHPEYDMPEDEITILMYLDLKKVKVEENKVVISLEKLPGYRSLSYYNTGGNPYIKSCDIVFKIKKFEDGTFKIRDYYIDNMITEVYQKEV